MARNFIVVGYSLSEETRPGVSLPSLTEKTYDCKVLKNRMKTSTSASVNSELTLVNEFSILADSFAYENYYNMKYVTYLGIKWSVDSVRVVAPRLVITCGGVYAG